MTDHRTLLPKTVQPNILLPISRRALLSGAAGAATLAVASPFRAPAIAQGASLKVGMMLPYTGTYAKLGQFIDDGFRLYVEQKGGKLGGRAISFVQVDDESKPEAATDTHTVDFPVPRPHIKSDRQRRRALPMPLFQSIVESVSFCPRRPSSLPTARMMSCRRN